LGKLHDDPFGMEFSHGRAPLIGGQSTTLRFTPKRDGKVVLLDIVHTQKLHLLIASRDLSSFDHVHPQATPDGAFELPYSFPFGGEFLLFADCTPMGERNQVFRITAQVEGSSHSAQPIPAPQDGYLVFGNYRAAMAANPKELVAGSEAVLTVSIKDGDLPVTDLQPLLGASGHCVAIHEGGEDYIHIHPADARPGAAIGPQVSFHARFPRQGRYRVWTQFQRGGRMLTFPFSVDVR
jgi:hypothetical protein